VRPPPLGLSLTRPAEPTSALDAETCDAVERDILRAVHAEDSPLQALVWITHSAEQAQRVGTRFFDVADAAVREVHEARRPDV
jgi:ABC-type iron transport system FetAB ATPase subunit